jgi:iron(III) transport system permease protein
VASTDELSAIAPAPLAPAAPTEGPPGPAPLALRAVCGAVGLLFALPLGYLVWRTATGDESLASLYTSEATLVPLRNTLVLAAATAASTAVVGTGLAWLTTRTDLPLRRLWAVLAALPLVFPSFVGALALLAAVSSGGLLDGPLGWVGISLRPEGFDGAWLVLTLFTTPYVLLPVSARLAALPPSLEESARLLGRRPPAVFATVVWPQVRGAVGAGSLLVFLYALSDFGVVVLLRYDTLTRVIFTNRVLDRDRSVALSLLLAVLALAVVAGERTLARRRPAVEAVRSRRPLQVPLGRWRWPALALVAGWVAVALGGPLASLGLWAWRGLAGEGSSLAAGGTGFGDMVEPAANTVGIGLVTAVVAVAVVLPLAYLSARYRARAADVATGLVATGFALPALVIALAVVYWTVQLPEAWGLYQSFVMLVFGYVVHLGVQSLRAAQVAVGSVPRRLDESARMLGAGRARRFATVDLPLMLPGLAAGGGLVLLSTMKELPITLLTAPTGFETLAIRIWADAEAVFLAEAALASIVLVALSGVLTWFLVVRRSDRLA